MKGKYKKGKWLWVRFDLEEDRELAEAYSFFSGGVPEVTKILKDPTKSELQNIAHALHRDAVEHNNKIQVCERYNICTRCGGEIDLRLNVHEIDPEYPDMGLFRHKTCPPRRNVYEKDL